MSWGVKEWSLKYDPDMLFSKYGSQNVLLKIWPSIQNKVLARGLQNIKCGLQNMSLLK